MKNSIVPTEELYGSPEMPWRTRDGNVIACTEKLKVMRQNFAELRQGAMDLLEDVVLMGCDEVQVKEALNHLIQSLATSFKMPS